MLTFLPTSDQIFQESMNTSHRVNRLSSENIVIAVINVPGEEKGPISRAEKGEESSSTS